MSRVLSPSVPVVGRRSALRASLRTAPWGLAGVGLVGLSVAALSTACAPPLEGTREPMGRLPGLVTTAQPEWMPRPIFAGDALPDDPRERRLAEPRSVDPGGEPRRVAWAPGGDALFVETRAAGGACEAVVRVDLAGGPPRPIGAGSAPPASPAAGSEGPAAAPPATTRTRLGAALADGNVLVAESPCAEPPERAAWSLVVLDPTSGARRTLARLEGEVTGVATDGRAAFVAVSAARRARVERVALDGGSPRALLEVTEAAPPAVSAATATLVVLRQAVGAARSWSSPATRAAISARGRGRPPATAIPR